MKNETNVMDERQKQINSNALAAAGIFLMVCISVSMIYKVWTTGNTGWEFWALLGSGLVSGITQRILGDIEQPKSISGKPLPVENTKEAKRVRRIDYALQSVGFAVTCAVMDILFFSFGKKDTTDYELTQAIFPNLDKGLTIVITAVIALATAFIVSYIFEYLFGEHFKVKRYNKMISELEQDD